jgi:hypothetical protein
MPAEPARLASGCSELKHPKGQTRADKKGKLDYRERQIIDRNRAKCVRRDGDTGCRIGHWGDSAEALFGECYGKSEWNHFDKRSLTMNEPPEDRHSSAITGMLCGTHHDLVDDHKIKFEYLTEDGADGVMAFWKDPQRKLIEEEMPKPRYR